MTGKGERPREAFRRRYFIGIGLLTRPNSVARPKIRVEQAS